MEKSRPSPCQPQPVFIIQAVSQPLVQQPETGCHAPPEKDGRLAQKTDLFQSLRVPGFRRVGLHNPTLHIDMITPSVNHLHLRVLSKKIRHAIQRLRVIDVIRVEPADDVSSRGADSLVDGIRLAPVSLRDPAKATLPSSQYLQGLIRAPAIDDHVFQTRNILIQDTPDGPADEIPLIQRRRNDTDGWERHMKILISVSSSWKA
jgi:hypothetical protein